MIQILALLGGIAIAAGVFSAFLWSAYQIVMARGSLRFCHAALVVLTVAGMASLQAAEANLAGLVGAGLLAAALAGIVLETRWSRLLPALQAVFGVALFIGLPFS
ncbi:MAG: hypothetical protein AAGC92_09170 [Pseudomonadota bacterium]